VPTLSASRSAAQPCPSCFSYPSALSGSVALTHRLTHRRAAGGAVSGAFNAGIAADPCEEPGTTTGTAGWVCQGPPPCDTAARRAETSSKTASRSAARSRGPHAVDIGHGGGHVPGTCSPPCPRLLPHLHPASMVAAERGEKWPAACNKKDPAGCGWCRKCSRPPTPAALRCSTPDASVEPHVPNAFPAAQRLDDSRLAVENWRQVERCRWDQMNRCSIGRRRTTPAETACRRGSALLARWTARRCAHRAAPCRPRTPATRRQRSAS
jgi:hypothetical protein